MEQKEGFCTVCSIPVPSAFSDYDGGYEDENNSSNKFKKFKKFLNNCNIPVILIIAIAIYLIFFYKK
uniref:Uncharacterized protein n=1 Tax=viral metagenome TaxID=1070528 RepID=A0A6C0E1H5_9ZZZZ